MTLRIPHFAIRNSHSKALESRKPDRRRRKPATPKMADLDPAENIRTGPQRQPESTSDRSKSNCPTNHDEIWYKVRELPHDFGGRKSKISKVLQKCHSNLVDNGFYSAKFLDLLYSRHCISVQDKEQVCCLGNDYEKSRELLRILCTKPDSTLEVLLECLAEDETRPYLPQLIRDTMSPVAEIIAPYHVWYTVGELPYDFLERDSADIHKRLDKFHSNESVDANIVCISGPAGCGKSTLARKYAFDNFPSFYSDVVWIEAGSLDEMRVSFEGLAAYLQLPVESDTQRLVSSVYKFFNRRKCLFIFDGLERMEDFSHFRPKITSTLCQTPYLLITSTRSGLAPDPENQLCIAHDSAIVLKIFERIEREKKPAADLLKVLAYLDPEKISGRFLQAVFEQMDANDGGDFDPCLALLREFKVIKFSILSSPVIIAPPVQEAIRSSLRTAEQESPALVTIRKTHQALMDTDGVKGELTCEGTAHRLYVLRLDLKSISLTDHFDQLWCDFEYRSVYTSALSIAQDAHAILNLRFDKSVNEATIYTLLRMADAYERLENFAEAIRILESLLPKAKSILGETNETTGSILHLLSDVYKRAGDSERATHYSKERENFIREALGRRRAPKKSPDTSQGYNLVEVQYSHPIWRTILNSMNNSIVTHQGNIGGIFRSYEILKLEKVHNENLTRKYKNRQEEVLSEAFDLHERRLFHGTNLENVNNILEHGLDERYGDRGMFGAGIYFAEHSSKSNQYVFGQAGCPRHHDTSCYSCERKMLICAVTLGTSVIRDKAARNAPHPPPGYHSLTGIPGGDLQYPEYIIYRGDQANPEYVVTYRIVE